jgi:REP element-mobilizing transposase RayT
MPRTLRVQYADAWYHVMDRGAAKQTIFHFDFQRARFLELLGDITERFEVEVHAYCLMDNHYHLLVGSTRENLSLGLHRLNGLYAQRFNRRHRRKGHLFGDRFWASVVEDEHFQAARAYILLNPVRAELCDVPEQFRWSGSPYGKDVLRRYYSGSFSAAPPTSNGVL